MEKLEYAGPYIYYICQVKNLSLSAISSYAGITYMELNNIYNGKFEPHPNTIKRICDFIGIDFIALFKKQEKYTKLLNDAFHSLTYDIIDEQKTLMQKVEGIDFEKSILFPEYLLLKVIYLGVNDPMNEEYESLLEKLSLFINVFCSDYKGLYYIYKGVYYRVRNKLQEAEKYFELALKILPFNYSELLYQQYGTLRYLQDKYLETLDFYYKAYALYEKKWNINRLLYTKDSIGFCYIGMRRYDLADKELKKTLSLAKQYKNEYVIQECYSDLSYAHLMMRDYQKSIEYAMQAIKAGSNHHHLSFFLAYSYARIENYGEAALWAGKREQMSSQEAIYKCLVYVKQIIDRQEDSAFMEELYHEMQFTFIKEARMLLLEDIAEIYKEEGLLEDENRILCEMLKMIK